MERRSPKRYGDAAFMPGAVALTWMGLAFYLGSDWFQNVPGRPKLDINMDGTTTISDVWLLLKNSWIAATSIPAVSVLMLIAYVVPDIYRFLELGELLSRDWVLILFGLGIWFGVLVGLTILEARVRGRLDEWSERRLSARIDAVRRGERDRFP